jgi:hypothetical protein
MRSLLWEYPLLSTCLICGTMFIVCIAIVVFAYSFNKAPDK